MRQGLWWLLVIAAVLPLGGCGTTNEEKVTAINDAATFIQNQSAQLDAQLVQLDGLITKTQADLANPVLAGPARDQLAKLLSGYQNNKAAIIENKAKFDTILADLADRSAKLKAGGSVDMVAIVQMVAQVLGTAGATVGGAAGGWIGIIASIVLGLTTIVGGAATVVKSQQLKVVTADRDVTNTALSEVVVGNEEFKKVLKEGLSPISHISDTPPLQAFKVAHDEAQSKVTQGIVAEIRATA